MKSRSVIGEGVPILYRRICFRFKCYCVGYMDCKEFKAIAFVDSSLYFDVNYNFILFIYTYNYYPMINITFRKYCYLIQLALICNFYNATLFMY